MAIVKKVLKSKVAEKKPAKKSSCGTAKKK